MGWLSKTVRVDPYSRLANIYDHVMRHVNYQRWAHYLQRLMAKSEQQIRVILDISCGTGSLLLALSDLGYRCSGFDSSVSMVQRAKKKIANQSAHIPVWVGNMTRFTTRKQSDVICCLYDSINYCRTPGVLLNNFTCVFDALSTGGLFIFDISTLRNSKRYFQNYHDLDQAGEIQYIRQSYFVRRTRTQVNEFRIMSEQEPGLSFLEKHEQRIYGIEEIIEVIPRDLFSVLGVYDGFTLRPGGEKSDRVHFVLKKI